MKDKKCCDNCEVKGCERAYEKGYNPCEEWQPSPDMWLDIPPISGGEWFHRIEKPKRDEIWAWEILTVITVPEKTGWFVWDDVEELMIPVAEIGGQWQGPILPKGE